MEDLFKRAKKGDVSIVSILKDEKVDKIKDEYWGTPLQYLAFKGVKEVLDHPSVDKIKDSCGETPLHSLALAGVKEVLQHPSVDQIKDKYGCTPLHYLASAGVITKKELKKRFPFIKSIEGEHIENMVRRIVNTPQSVKFIMGD